MRRGINCDVIARLKAITIICMAIEMFTDFGSFSRAIVMADYEEYALHSFFLLAQVKKI